MASPSLTVNIKTQRAQARLGKALKKIEDAGQATTQDLVTMGKEYARIVVPKFSGWTYSTIKGKVTKTNSGSQGEIYVSPTIVPNDGIHRGIPRKNSKWKYIEFDLVRWMHTSPKASTHIKSGSPTFMYDTRDYLKGALSSTIKGRYKNLKF